MSELKDFVPDSLWEPLALVFAAAFLYIIKQSLSAGITLLKTWLEKQSVDFKDLKDIVNDLATVAKVQEEINKTTTRRLDDHDDDLRDLRQQPTVKY